MTVSPAITAQAAFPQASCLGVLLRRSLYHAALILAVLLTLFLWIRLASGALGVPLSPRALATAGVVLAIAAYGLRAWGQALHGDCLWAAWFPLALIALIALALSLPNATWNFGLLILWLAVLAAAVVQWREQCPAVTFPKIGDHGLELTSALPLASVSEAVDVEAAGELDESVTQQFVRRQNDAGEDSVTGWLRVKVPAGGRTVYSHVAFCPPFATLPQCFAEAGEGPAARVKVAQVLPQGARLEIKLDREFAEPQSVLVEFSASSATPELPLG